MRWKGRPQSSKVEDRRRIGGGRMAMGGGVGIVVVAALMWLLGGDPGQVLNNIQTTQTGNEYGLADSSVIQAEQELAQFASVVLKDTEDIWHAIFREQGRTYREPTLVLFSSSVQSACGFTSSAVGPFYCPGDERLYIDLSFLADLQQRLGARGDFAMAYIIAHEVGHHVQNLLGVMDEVRQLQAQGGESEARDAGIALELQADFLAGIWAHHAEKTKGILEEGDVDEAIGAASAVGDDRIQMKTQGYVVPDSFTHGTSEERKSWFLRGFRTGDLSQGNTLGSPS